MGIENPKDNLYLGSGDPAVINLEACPLGLPQSVQHNRKSGRCIFLLLVETSCVGRPLRQVIICLWSWVPGCLGAWVLAQARFLREQAEIPRQTPEPGLKFMTTSKCHGERPCGKELNVHNLRDRVDVNARQDKALCVTILVIINRLTG